MMIQTLYDTIDDIDDKINELSCIPEVNQFLEAEALGFGRTPAGYFGKST